jgi:ABC-type multidrug transport system fused ATPase/permease subunit
MKGRADRLLRIRELQDGFGWEPDITSIADILATIPEKFEMSAGAEQSNEFASRSAPSSKRAFENLKESAWWTQQLALGMFKWMATIFTCLLVFSLVFLILATVSVVSDQSRVTVARVVTALILLITTAGLAKLTYSYYLLYENSRNTVRRVRATSDSDDLVRRIGVLYDYQSARATGPLIPNTIYKKKRARLNTLWTLQAHDDSL